MESNDVAMTFWEHLEELRRRIIICLISLGVFSIIGLMFTGPIRYVLELPLKSPIANMIGDMIETGAGEDDSILGFIALTLKASNSNVAAELVFTGPLQNIMSYLILGITTGIIVSIPVILYQVWMFIIPALKRSERRMALPLFFTFLFFFILGTVFAHLIVVPVVLHFSANLFPEMRNLWDFKTYIGFVTALVLGFGVAFELPVVMAFLARIGVTDWRGFQRKQRHALIGIAFLSALLTPADPWSMLLMAIPLFILYQLGIFFAYLVEKET